MLIFVVTTKHKQTAQVHARAFYTGELDSENGNWKWKHL